MTNELDRCSTNRPRVLVFNFFYGIKARGIPLYARDLQHAFFKVGADCIELRAPGWLRTLPAALQNVVFVFYEQLVAPLLARCRGCCITVYPYNSCSLLDATLGRGVLVVHDLIPNRKSSRGLASRYIRACQAAQGYFAGTVAAVSHRTQRQLVRLKRFERCPQFFWGNAFYSFEEALVRHMVPGAVSVSGERSLLLCSGMGANKDFGGALRRLMSLPVEHPIHVTVLGFGDDASLAERRVRALPEPWRHRVTILPRLDLQATVAAFMACEIVWVHSLSEGFGRPVVEARVCGKPVLASDIGAFRQLRKMRAIHLYGATSFAGALEAAAAEALAGCATTSAASLNAQLEGELRRFLTEGGRRR